MLLKLDEKGRVLIPARIRRRAEKEGLRRIEERWL